MIAYSPLHLALQKVLARRRKGRRLRRAPVPYSTRPAQRAYREDLLRILQDARDLVAVRLLPQLRALGRAAGVRQDWPDSEGHDDHGRGEPKVKVTRGQIKTKDAGFKVDDSHPMDLASLSMNAIENGGKFTERRVKLADLTTEQASVSASIVAKYRGGEHQDPVIVVRERSGRLLLVDGNHRAVAARLNGEERVNALVISEAEIVRVAKANGIDTGEELKAERTKRNDDARLDAWPEDVREIFRGIREAMHVPVRARAAAGRARAHVDAIGLRTIRAQMRAVLGVDVLANSPRLSALGVAFVEENVSLITGLPERYLAEIEQLVLRHYRQGRRQEELERELEERYEVSERRAAVIARDQVNKLNGDLTRVRQEDLGIEEYVWRTVKDERVRDSHQGKEGHRFRWDDPPADTGHPGEDILCRCFPEPVLDGLLDE